MTQMGGTVMAKWVGYCFWEICSKSTGLQGSKILILMLFVESMKLIMRHGVWVQ